MSHFEVFVVLGLCLLLLISEIRGKLFPRCKHEWQVKAQEVFKSPMEVMHDSGYEYSVHGAQAVEMTAVMTKKTSVIVMACVKCGKLRAIKTSN